MKIIIVGSKSFIAKQFVSMYSGVFEIKCFSRGERNGSEIVKYDYFDITEEELQGYDILINFAAIVHVPNTPDSLYKKVNYDLALNLAKKCKAARVHHFIQMSSIAVYGSAQHITDETIINAENAYGKYKALADAKIWELKSPEFYISIVRPPMVYGGSSTAPGNMQRLITLAQKGIPLPLKSMNNQRHFIHVKNLISCLKCIIENAKESGLYIPSDRKSYSTEDVLNRIGTLTHKDIRLFKLPGFLISILKEVKPEIFERVYGNKTIYAQPELLEIGYKPEYTLTHGLKEMLEIH